MLIITLWLLYSFYILLCSLILVGFPDFRGVPRDMGVDNHFPFGPKHSLSLIFSTLRVSALTAVVCFLNQSPCMYYTHLFYLLLCRYTVAQVDCYTDMLPARYSIETQLHFLHYHLCLHLTRHMYKCVQEYTHIQSWLALNPVCSWLSTPQRSL